METVKKSLDDHELMCAVFTNSQKAFDTVSYEILIEKLSHHGISS